MREAFQKMLAGRNMQDLSAEERQKLGEQMRSMMGGARSGQARATGKAGLEGNGARARRR